MNGICWNNGVNYETVTTLEPIVNRTVNCVDRYYLVVQPYVNEHHTVYNDHVVKQNVYQNVAATENYCDYTEQTVYNNGCNNNYGGNWF